LKNTIVSWEIKFKFQWLIIIIIVTIWCLH
jgi:hypothetical protein